MAQIEKSAAILMSSCRVVSCRVMSCRGALCAQQPAVEGGLGRVQVIDKLSRARLPALYGAVDVLVQPSRGEGWGLPMVEAMACGAKNAFATHLCI
jgi:glycosyltransferase involved in cell wall biosynthesis